MGLKTYIAPGLPGVALFAVQMAVPQASRLLPLVTSSISVDKFLPSQADVLRNLPQERRGDIAAGVVWNRGAPAVGVAELNVRPALPDGHESVLLKERNNFPGL